MIKYSLLTAAAGLAFVAMNAAHAGDGTITFQGSVVASTCKINGGNNDLTVQLPRAATNQLASVGATAGRTPFTLALSGCTTDKKGEDGQTVIPAPVKKVSVAFEPGPNVNLGSGRLTLMGADAAKGVEIAILNDKYEPVKIGADSALQGVQVADIDTALDGAGTATLQFAAQYVATGPVTGGSANSFVTYSLTYP
ncbi:fimbrial protein [Burkholderia multivorans]|uniref:fimbrial protein n=1 Tax=Burkholderia multivorans TaxID=87883 RepID=UPI000D339C7C|nr:fimbrial protein [Burkholderia multivorans]MBR8021786.1 type 1 fimbrial protein [Burkholderia multivorans]MEB2512257.1 fimbrial protein [Burkholderia multivorans]MEB2523631.1 fimbrial protein [Burkholderia multivorans]MEB2575854.1 fimbrial protein [Burkholderia multivorans]MEB2591504.1 fimbrial protein [Burkholderia multivorans]